jgi:Kelch motif protein
MGDVGRGGPVRLTILLASIAGLLVLGLKTAGSENASATHTAGHGAAGRIVAVVSRRSVPVMVRRQIALPAKRGAAAIRVAGATYMLGGTQRTAHGGRVPVGSVLRIDGAGPPTRVAKLPMPVTGAAPAAVGDRLYAIGGRLPSGKLSDRVQEYDIATEHSVIAARLPKPVWHSSALTLDGSVYVLGGITSGGTTSSIVRFDPWRDATSRAGHLPVRAAGGAAAAVRSRRGYLVGASAPGSSRLNFVITLRALG